MNGYYLQQRPLLEIAEELGVTQSRASQLRSEGLDMLREALQALLEGEPGRRGAGQPGRGQGPAPAGLRAAVANRSSVHRRADVQAYLDGNSLLHR